MYTCTNLFRAVDKGEYYYTKKLLPVTVDISFRNILQNIDQVF